ncbi:MAG: phosphatidylserine/phosphatidylglycerophosphate/cardiolipin synthase family protein [Candidatus Riflebacteria bacterium]|nr:phosphatidylserine/phosphatidylglycerophosphate/cardiolipin synthase family protein [Candidatus Riflebacteria bacterium]
MKGMPDCFKALSVFPNVEIKIYNSVSQSIMHMVTDFSGLFASCHKKILISDGKFSLTGGRNIGPDYFAGPEEYPCVYRDTDILIEGPHASERFKAAFEDEWICSRNSVVKPPSKTILQKELDRIEIAAKVMDSYLNGKGLAEPESTNSAEQKAIFAELNDEISKFKNISSFAGFELFTNEPELPVKILEKNSSLGKLNGIAQSLKDFAEVAREDIIIQNPYVVLSNEAMDVLRRASARFVKILIHSNSGGSTDSLFPQAFLMNDWKKMLAEMPTLRLLVAPGALQRLHSKTFVADRHIVIIGSYNMDPLSKDSNAEAVAVVNDKNFAEMVYNQTQKDIARGVLEYKIKRDVNGKPLLDKKGRPIKEFGPEDHLDPKTIKKMNIYRQIGLLRPFI